MSITPPFDQETGELLEGKEEELAELQAKMLENKENGKKYLDFYLKQYNESKASEASIKLEIERLEKLRAKSKEHRELKVNIENIVKALFNNKYENDMNSVSFRKSEAVDITDKTLVDKRFTNY